MIKISAGQQLPRFYLPVKKCVNTRQVECYLFFIAPFAMLYEKTVYTFWYLWVLGILENDRKIFRNARKTMNETLKNDDGLRESYKANIAMCIYDNRRKDGRLNHKECNEVADKLIKLIFD